MEPLGTHLLVEFYSCNFKIIDSIEIVKSVMIEAVNISGATIVEPVFHKFAPQGVSGVVVIEESHFAIHTWPEHGYASIDLYSCGEFDYMEAVKFLKKKFDCQNYQISSIKRGIIPKDGKIQQLEIINNILID